MNGKWTKERIWEWYNARPWIRGCNFMSSDCANRIDQWQEYGFEERFATAERELRLAAETGFNSIRIIPEFYVWEQEHDGFVERLERYISAAAENGISCMLVFGNDCCPPKSEALSRLHLGEQNVDWGYHGGRRVSQHGRFDEAGYSLFDDEAYADKFIEFVSETVERYKSDERVIIWDVFNEPGNSNRDSMSLPLMKRMFEAIRAINPIQPLTAAVWRNKYAADEVSEIEKFGLDNSDLISFHSYENYLKNVKEICELKKYGRPIINTEWLNRCGGNTVEELFPLFFLEKIGCYNWGFVAGKYQTYEPWNSVWDYYAENPDWYKDFDFTKWLHDLYRPSLNPYNPKEIKLIKELCELADKEFAKQNKA